MEWEYRKRSDKGGYEEGGVLALIGYDVMKKHVDRTTPITNTDLHVSQCTFGHFR